MDYLLKDKHIHDMVDLSATVIIYKFTYNRAVALEKYLKNKIIFTAIQALNFVRSLDVMVFSFKSN